MKVALVLEHFDPLRGGLEQWTWRFADAILRRGCEVHVVARSFGDRAKSLSVVAHPLGKVRSRLAFAEAAQAKLMALAPDVIHDMGMGCYCDVFHPHGGSWASAAEWKLALWPSWFRPIKRHVDRLLPRHRAFRRLMDRQYADHGQLLVALSHAVADDFEHLHGVPSQRIRIVHNGVDTDHFSPAHRPTYRATIRRQLGIDEGTVLALIVAHNFRLKGVPTLLGAMRRLKHEDRPLHLVVVGGRRLSPWRRMARRLGVGGDVSFVGCQDETVPYYAAADLYVHPTAYDPCSLVVLEAAASGLPIVTTAVNGVSELFRDGVEGYLLDNPTSVEGLASRMQLLLEDSVRAQMGAAAREVMLDHTMGRNVDEILSIYEEVIRSRHSLLSDDRRSPRRNPPATSMRPQRSAPRSIHR